MLTLAALDPTLGVLIVGVVAALGAYLTAAKRFSGKIGSSDAEQLWTEARSIRDWSKQRIESLEQRVSVVENVNEALGRENTNLVQQVRDLSDTITELRAEIVNLTKELRESHERVEELEDDAT